MATPSMESLWGQYGTVGLGVANTFIGAFTQQSAAKYQSAVSNANYRVQYAQYESNRQLADQQYAFQKELQGMYNRIADSQNASQAFIQSMNNLRQGQYLGEQYNAVQENIQRVKNAATQQSVIGQIQLAENMGRTAAAAAAAGVTGTTVGLINRTQQLQQDITQQAIDKGTATQVYDLVQQRAGIETNINQMAFQTVQSDYSRYDYSQPQRQLFIEPVKQVQSVPSFASSFMASLANSGLQWKDFANAFASKTTKSA